MVINQYHHRRDAVDRGVLQVMCEELAGKVAINSANHSYLKTLYSILIHF